MTFACWFYSINNANYARIFDFGNGNQGTNGIFMYIYNNSIGIGVKTDNTTLVQVDSNNYNDSTWYHVVWTMTYSAGNTSTWKAYIDASLSFTGTNNRYPQQVARSSCFLGRSNFVADPSYNGYIDDFRVYQRVLTQTEINTLYYYDNTLTANSAIFKWNVPNKRGGTLSYNYYFADNSLNFSEISNNTTSTNAVLTNQLNGNGIQYYVKAQIPPNKQSAYANISSNFTYINSPTNLTVSQGYSIPLTNANFSTPSTASYLYITSGLGQVVTGWTLSYLPPSSGAGGFIIGKSGSSPFDPSVNSISGESYIGAQTGFGGSTNNLSFYQTQYLTNDASYSLSFYTSGTKDASYSSSTTLSVSISGQTTISNLVSNFVVSNINWAYLSYAFTVSTTASYNILFTIINNGGGDNTINVTDVSLVKINNASLSWTASQTNGTIDTHYGTYDSSSVVHIPLNTDSALVKYYPFFYNDTLNYASGVGVNDITLVNTTLTTSVYKFGIASLTQVNTSTQPYFTYPTIPTNTNKYTISFWINLYQYGGVTHYLYNSPNISITYVPGAFNSLFVYLNSQATQLSSVSLNTWTHIALTVDTSNNTTGTAYVNNVATTTSAFTSFRFTDLSNVKVLQYNPVPAVPMSYMVDFRYYNRVLSSTDISSLYYYTGLSNYSNGNNNLNSNSTTAGILIPWGLSLNKFKVQGKLTNNLYSSPSNSVSFIGSSYYVSSPTNLTAVQITTPITNNDFATPTTSSYTYVTSQNVTGWTVSSISSKFVIGKSGSSIFDPSQNSISGTQYIGTQTTAIESQNFYQNVSLYANKTYLLSFYVSARYASYTSTCTLAVDICGSTTNQNLVSGFIPPIANWLNVSYPFTVSSTATYALNFITTNTAANDSTINITNVSLTILDSVKLSWTAPSTNGNITGYYYSYDNGITLQPTNSTSLSYEFINDFSFTSTPYYFLVSTDISQNNILNPVSNEVSSNLYYPGTITNFTATQSTTDSTYTTANISWSAPATTYGTLGNYTIKYFDNTSITLGTSTTSGTSTAITGLTKGDTIYFLVYPSITQNTTSPTISYEQSVTLYYTNAPASLSISQSTSLTQATLTWTIPGNYLGTINNYYYGYSTSSGTGITYSATGSGSTYSGTLTGLTASTSGSPSNYYFYALAGISEVGVSGPYIQSPQYTMYYVSPPTNLSIAHQTDASGISYLSRITFSWTASSTNGGTVTYYWSCSGPTYVYSGNTQSTSVDISNLTAGSTNTFNLYAQISNITSYNADATPSSLTLGTITGATDVSYGPSYTLYSFKNTGSGTLTCNNRSMSAFTIIVAGGGAASGGGGGAGTVAYGILQYNSNTSYTITIGGGGVGTVNPGVSGDNTTIVGGTGTTIDILTRGGGGGGRSTGPGSSGGSGGGAGGNSTPSAISDGSNNSVNNGTVTFAYNAGGTSNATGNTGGGGGAGAAGVNGSSGNGGNGGVGINFPNFGGYYGGGGGGRGTTGTSGTGGLGGGGNASGSGTGTNGTANTGGGGGGSNPSFSGGSGGSGIIVLAFRN
jgi:hypothetical protein